MNSIDKIKIVKRLNRIQDFISENESKDSKGYPLSDFDKLCFVQDDLTELRNLVGSL